MSMPARVRSRTREAAGSSWRSMRWPTAWHDVDLQAALGQAARGFQAEEAATEHKRRLRGGGRPENAVAIVQSPEREGVLQAGDRRNERLRAGGEHEVVVGQHRAIGEPDRAGHAIDSGRGDADPSLGARGHADVGRLVFSGQDRGEQDAVVSRVRLGAEHRDFGIRGGKLVGQTGSGHAEADNARSS